MFKKKYNSQKVDTIIGKNTFLKGTLQAEGTIRIEGTFEGDITTKTDIIIATGAVVKAKIKCCNATLGGRVEGNIAAKNKLDIRSNGVLIGDIQAGILAIEEGAHLEGNCKMHETKKEKSNQKK